MTRYPTTEDFLRSDARRCVPVWDFGDQWMDADVRHRIFWVPTTQEVCVQAIGHDELDVIGTVPSERLLAALLRREGGDYPLKWARDRIRSAPRYEPGIAVAIAAAARADAIAEARRRERERTRYTVVAVTDLPRALVNHEDDLCRECAVGNWAGIAAAAVQALRAGLDPLDVHAVRRAARQRLRRRADRRWFVRLFTAPIELHGSGELGNGRHRADALRRSGAPHCVIVRR